LAIAAAAAEGAPPKPNTPDAASQQVAAVDPAATDVATETAPTELAALPPAEADRAIVVPKSAQTAPPARPVQVAAVPDVADAVAEAVEVAVAEVAETSVPSAIEDTAAVAAVTPEPAAEPAPLQLAVAVMRPAKRNAPIFDEVAATSETAELEPEIITRVSTSGGRYWGVNVGRFSSSYEAERALLKTQLAESATLNDGLRKVIKKSGGFDANFMGLSQEQADLACRRLQARAVQCFTIGP
jgi:D-alanyl-D-alanine carboxypeptidase